MFADHDKALPEWCAPDEHLHFPIKDHHQQEEKLKVGFEGPSVPVQRLLLAEQLLPMFPARKSGCEQYRAVSEFQLGLGIWLLRKSSCSPG